MDVLAATSAAGGRGGGVSAVATLDMTVGHSPKAKPALSAID